MPLVDCGIEAHHRHQIKMNERENDMGQAKRRGDFETRKQLGEERIEQEKLAREQARLVAEQEQKARDVAEYKNSTPAQRRKKRHTTLETVAMISVLTSMGVF